MKGRCPHCHREGWLTWCYNHKRWECSVCFRALHLLTRHWYTKEVNRASR